MLGGLGKRARSSAPPPFGRTLFFYYAHVFSYDFIFGYAIFPVYFQLQGISPEIIGAILAFWAAGIIVLELPAGLLADIFDRRVLLVLSPLAKSACFLIWIFAGQQVHLYFVGMVFWSLASALRSGAKEALLYEHIEINKQTHRYTTILGRERALQEGATLTGAVLGGLMTSVDLKLAFWISLAPLGFCALAACFVPDPRRSDGAKMHFSLKLAPDLLRFTWTEFFSRREVRHVTLYVALCVSFVGTLEDFNQLFLLAVNAPVWSIGVIIGAIGLVRLILAYHAGWFERFPAFSWLAPLGSGVALFVSGFMPPLFAVLAMATAFALIAPLLVLSASKFQQAIDGASRATTTSVMSALMEALSVVFNLAIAFLFSQLDVLKTYQVGGAYLVLFAVWEMAQKRRAVPLPEAARAAEGTNGASR